MNVVLAEAGGLEVLVQIGLEGECLVAAGALVVLVGRVSLHVGTKVGAIGEGLAAMGTAVGFFAGVTAKMALKEPGTGEHFAADAAAVSEFVSEDVHGESGHAHVGLAAVDALFGRLGVETAMGLLVS